MTAAGDTPVTKWLTKNDAATFAKAFSDAGYFDVEDLDGAVINDLVGKTSRGTAKRLTRKLPQNVAKADRTPPPVPQLPPGQTLDLSAPQTPAMEDGSRFTLPASLPDAVATADYVDPLALLPSDWMIIARHMRLLYGWDMSRTEPRQATRPLLMWKVPEATDQFVQSKTDIAEISTSIVYDESSQKYVTSGFNQETAEAGYAFASASFSRQASWSNSHSARTTDLYMTGSWWFPRATIDLRQCTVLHPNFLVAIRTAVAAPDPQTALQQVFSDYGHAIPMIVTVGGELFFSHAQHGVATEDTSKYEETLSAAVSIKVGSASGGAGVSTGSGSSTDTAAQSLADSTKLQARGGEVRDIENRPKWEDSVANPNMWSVIRDDSLGRAKAVLDLLAEQEPDLAKQVREAARGLIGQPVAWLADTVKTLTSDGFVLGMLAQEHWDGTRGSLYASTDATSNPAAVRGGCCTHTDTAPKSVSHASLLMPVRATEHAIVRFTGEDPPPPPTLLPTPEVYFFTLGPHADGGYLGPWQNPSPITLGNPFTAPTDGFLVGSLQTIKDGTRGWLRLTSATNTPLAGCTVHRWTPAGNFYNVGSFCVPLPKGTAVTPALASTPENLQVGDPGDYAIRLDWLPLQNGLMFGPTEPRTARPTGSADVNTAETDGFFVATLGAPTGGVATVRVAVTPPSGPDGQPLAPRMLGCTSIHRHAPQNPTEDNWVVYNTLTVPIRAGSTYQPTYGTGTGDVDRTVQANFYWTPLLKTIQDSPA
jgi:hypothetical protein